MRRIVSLLLAVAAGLLVCSIAWSQAIFSTITGTVQDPSGAVVPGAQVTLTNATSGTVRQTTANTQGYYTFASVPVGTYNLDVTSPGFQKFELKGIQLGGGELRSINASLKIGAASQSVQVSAAGDLLTPVSTGEQTFTLRAVQLQNYVQTGSNAAEFLKIMPGVGIQNGTQNTAGYTGQVIGINANGNGGSQSPLNNNFSYNGMPGNTLDIVSDGAHVSDPGCNCDTPVNPNSNFLQEFKVLSTDFSAEDQKGPMVITSVTTAGGAQFHGNAFMQARNWTLNSNEAYNKAEGLTRPHDEFYYEGGSVGGPVIIPGIGFNKNRNKLFFFAGFEYFYQVLDSGVLNATVPTPAIINGDFSPASMSKLGNITASGAAPGEINPGTQKAWGGTTMPSNVIDPNMQTLMKLYPGPNADPNATGGYNYTDNLIFNQNNTQLVTRFDYDISNATKVWVRWNWQTEIQPFPVQLWGANTDQVPYPSEILGRNRSNSIAATLTHVFSPTLTNEFVFAYTQVLFPNVFSNPAAVDPKALGLTNPYLFSSAQGKPADTQEIPNYGGPIGTASEAALINNFGGFYVGGPGQGMYADKYMPSFSDTVTKVYRTHTFAAGTFWEWIKNAQPDSNNVNGSMTYYPGDNPAFTYGDAYADMLAGNLSGYSETNFNRLNAESYTTLEFFAQDSWAVTPKFTLNYGLRLTHFTPWKDDLNYGFTIFNPALYSSANNAACTAGPTFCGFEWHSKDSSVPDTGFPTRALFYQPRIGVAYDIHGNGNTVIRGGWGFFYYHTGQFTNGLATAAGEESTTISPTNFTSTPTQLFVKNLGTIGAGSAVPSVPQAVNGSDSDEPYTQDWNVEVDQRTPWQGLFSIAYIGNVSRDLVSTGGYGSNVNLVPIGSMLTSSNPGLANPNLYRPYLGYQDINEVTNNIYSNYNAMQLKWAHQGRGSILQLNYTWGHYLGIVGNGNTLGGYGATINPFVLRDNYSAMPADRRQIFNAAYDFNLPSPIHGGNRFAAGFVNGWQISGTTNLSSGANLTANSNTQNFGLNTNNAIIPGSKSSTNPNGIPINNQSIYGTSDMQLQPIVTCNPRGNLGPHQWVNGSCFAVPTTPNPSVGAVSLLPTLYGPTYFDSDLGIFKNFQIGKRESSKLRIRAQASNFLNHPLWSYPNSNALSLSYQQDPATGAITSNNPTFGMAGFKQGQRIIEFQANYYF